MKKIVVLAAAVLGLSSMTMTISQAADDIVETPAEATLSDAIAAQDDLTTEEVETTTNVADAAADTQTGEIEAVEAEDLGIDNTDAAPEQEMAVAPQDTPQVQKLKELYPLLVQRIKPYGEVCFEGEPCGITLTALGGAANGEPRDGEAVYNAVCQTCHATGLLGAPTYADAGAWGPRVSKGADTLYDHAINGFKAMPAKGGADIPDEEVINAVDYMIAAVS